MAMEVQPIDVGIDVSKNLLSVAQEEQQVTEIPNDAGSIRSWLKSLPGPARIAVEATGVFHVELVERAHRTGHTIYVIDGYRLNRYREGIGDRAKTDATDARLLRRYLKREAADLRPWSPPPKGYRDLQQLLLRRARLVQTRVKLDQSLRGLSQLGPSRRALIRHLDQLDQLLIKRIRRVLQNRQWQRDARRIQAIEGVGEITAAALVMTFQRGHFRNSDAFIAFVGLDVRPRQSGQSRGKEKLSKKGAPELRRLLFLAAMAARRSSTWAGFYERLLARGLKTTQAMVALARKIARVAFALLKNGSEYEPRVRQEGCNAT
jgi:transposase